MIAIAQIASSWTHPEIADVGGNVGILSILQSL